MQNVRVVSGESTVYRIHARPANIVVPASACNVIDGFVEDHFSEYRNPSALRSPLHRRFGPCARHRRRRARRRTAFNYGFRARQWT